MTTSDDRFVPIIPTVREGRGGVLYPDEWAELRNTPASIEEAASLADLRSRQLQELVAKAGKYPPIPLKTKEDSLITTMSVLMGISLSPRRPPLLEYLKGVEIVDTPGSADPIVSRGAYVTSSRRMYRFALYAGRALTADRDIHSRMSQLWYR